MLEAVELLVKQPPHYKGLDGKQFQGCFQALSNCWLLGGRLLFAQQVRGARDVQVDPEMFTWKWSTMTESLRWRVVGPDFSRDPLPAAPWHQVSQSRASCATRLSSLLAFDMRKWCSPESGPR